MSYINDSCGCDGKGNSYQSVIDASPLLSGSQEIAFSPQTDNFSFLDSLNVNETSSNKKILNNASTNNFSQNDDSKQTYSLDDLISMSNDNNTKENENKNKFSDNNIYNMNQNNSHFNFNETQNPNSNLNMPLQNNMQMQNNMPMQNNVQMPDSGMMRQTMPTHVNPELQTLMNKINLSNEMTKKTPEQSQDDETVGRFILKNFNIVLIVIIGLAWSDVAKFYINRSIKFGNGNHRYYVYYAVIASIVLYGTSKYIHYLK